MVPSVEDRTGGVLDEGAKTLLIISELLLRLFALGYVYIITPKSCVGPPSSTATDDVLQPHDVSIGADHSVLKRAFIVYRPSGESNAHSRSSGWIVPE